jgi:hypothetical protein
MKKPKTPKLSTGAIHKMICKDESLRSNLPCESVKFLFSDWEIDVLSLNKSDYLTEYEVKVSRSDFKADAKKRKWQFYTNRVSKLISNYFYYVCPAGLIKENEIPDFAGLIYATEKGLEWIKKAPRLHKEKCDRNKVLEKFYRITSERLYLGGCRMTYLRRESEEAYDRLMKESDESVRIQNSLFNPESSI